jgi:hypothetical protein
MIGEWSLCSSLLPRYNFYIYAKHFKSALFTNAKPNAPLRHSSVRYSIFPISLRPSVPIAAQIYLRKRFHPCQRSLPQIA